MSILPKEVRARRDIARGCMLIFSRCLIASPATEYEYRISKRLTLKLFYEGLECLQQARANPTAF